MIRSVTAIRHVAFEDLGLLEPLLEELGFEISYVNAWELNRKTAETADLVVFLGGPISVMDEVDYPFLSDEIAIARTRIAAAKPTLGICLGAQILARAIGGSVHPGPATEIGWAPLHLSDAGQASILTELGDTPVLHWHGEVCKLPADVERLAHTPDCAVQAFIPGANALALQFHIEAGAYGIEPWLIGHTGEIAHNPGVTVAKLRSDTHQNSASLRSAASKTFQRWLAEVGFSKDW
ncbi:MAG: glutamine amidotransferase [Candidatus Thiodiazotropha taylori]